MLIFKYGNERQRGTQGEGGGQTDDMCMIDCLWGWRVLNLVSLKLRPVPSREGVVVGRSLCFETWLLKTRYADQVTFFCLGDKALTIKIPLQRRGKSHL